MSQGNHHAGAIRVAFGVMREYVQGLCELLPKTMGKNPSFLAGVYVPVECFGWRSTAAKTSPEIFQSLRYFASIGSGRNCEQSSASGVGIAAADPSANGPQFTRLDLQDNLIERAYRWSV